MSLNFKERLARLQANPAIAFLLALQKNLQRDYIGLIAAGIAFYFLLAAFPALAAAISLYGLFADPQFVADQFNLLNHFLPPEAVKIFSDQAQSIIASNNKVLGFSFFISTGLTVYSATKGVNALISGFNVAYNFQERRNFIRLNVTAFLLTLTMMIYFLVSLSLVAVLPAVVHILRLSNGLEQIILLVRWIFLFAIALGGLEILYCFGPSRQKAHWHWFSAGSFMATILWLGVSSFFSLFVTHFGSYNETYGSLGAVVILLIWFWVSGLMILFGAEINSIIEHRQSDDPDSQKPKPDDAPLATQ